MPTPTPIQTSIVDGVSSFHAAPWNALVHHESPFLEHGFLASLENTGCVGPETGWTPQILIATINDDLVGALPLYRKDNSAGEFVFDWAWADASHRAAIPYYPKAVVAVPFTPVTGARLLTLPDHPRRTEIRRQLIEAALNFADQEKLSSIHFNFLTPEDRDTLQDFDLPLRTGVQYHWKNDHFQTFDDFLARFRSKQRANIRRERRKLTNAGVTSRIFQGDDITAELLSHAFAFYRDTIQKFFYGRQYLNEDFFQAVGEALHERLHLVFLFQDGQTDPFGGTFNLLKQNRLYGRYWGALKDIQFAHFEACIYRPVEWAIAHGIHFFEPGAGGDHKYDRGFEPTRTYSAHYLRHPALDRGVREFLTHERRHIDDHINALQKHSPLK